MRASSLVEFLKTLALSFLVALGTLIAMAIGGFRFFASGGGLVFPSIVAWAAGSLFALERRPRHLWLQVAAVGVLVASLINLYVSVWPRLYAPPPSYLRGGPNQLPPPK